MQEGDAGDLVVSVRSLARSKLMKPMTTNRRLAVVLICCAVNGCGLIAGLGGYSPGDGGAEGAIDGATDASRDRTAPGEGGRSDRTDSPEVVPLPSCDAGQCAPDPPKGWSTPFIVALDAGDAACPAGFGALPGFTLYVDPLDASCAPCGCGTPAGTTCTAPTVQTWNYMNCTTGPCAAIEVVGGCPPAPCSGSWEITAMGEIEGGYCAAELTDAAGLKGVPAVVCLLPSSLTAMGCDGGICAPVPPLPFARDVVCVEQNGQHACPAAFPAANGYDNSGGPACTAATCSCGSPAGGTCAATVHAYDDDASLCSGSFVGASTSGCNNGPVSSFTAVSFPFGDAGACTPSGGRPTPRFVDYVTVCCTGPFE